MCCCSFPSCFVVVCRCNGLLAFVLCNLCTPFTFFHLLYDLLHSLYYWSLRTPHPLSSHELTSDPLSSPLLPYAHLILSPLSPILSFRHLYSTHILPCVISFTSSIICHLYSLLYPVLALYPLSPPSTPLRAPLTLSSTLPHLDTPLILCHLRATSAHSLPFCHTFPLSAPSLSPHLLYDTPYPLS